MIKKTTILITGICIIAVVTGYLSYRFYQIPLDEITLYAISKDQPTRLRIPANYRLKHLTNCPTDQFSPASPLSFLVAAMDSSNADGERVKGIFQHYLSIGCNINGVNRGLRPLHEAILFKNAAAITYLLKNGADPLLTLEKPAGKAGKNAYQWADTVCEKTDDPCNKIRQALKSY